MRKESPKLGGSIGKAWDLTPDDLLEDNSRFLLMPVSFSLITLSPTVLSLPTFFYLKSLCR